jgi:spermidine synthase
MHTTLNALMLQGETLLARSDRVQGVCKMGDVHLLRGRIFWSSREHIRQSMLWIAGGFLVLSGIASLTYQVVWVRLLSLSIGSTSVSISTVLAAFFLGMALGSYLAERITRNRIDTLRSYVVLESLIGLSGLVLLPVLLNLDGLIARSPVLGTALGLKFTLAFLLLSLPTACMGATFPVMASILVRTQQQFGRHIGQLYSLNTAGAVLGAALCGFLFVPNWGLDGAVYIAVGLNLSIAGVALVLDRFWQLPPLDFSGTSAAAPQVRLNASGKKLRVRALIVLFATGFTSIATQVGWTKYLIIFTGSTLYGFSAILSIFLVGIALGAWVVRSRLESLYTPALWLAVGLGVLGGSLVLTRVWLSWLPPIYGALNHLQVASAIHHGVKYATVFLLLIVPTFLFGALFPVSLKLYCGDLSGVRARVGKAYAVNTLASILGAVAAGFWIIPTYGTDALLTAMAAVLLILPFLFLSALAQAAHRVAVTGLAALGMLGTWQLPHLDYADLIASVDYRYDDDARSGEEPRFLFLKEGKAGVISLVSYDEQVAKLQNNGINESIIHIVDPDRALVTETLLGLIPYLLHKDPGNAFVLGFGGGITTRTLTLTDIRTIRVVELEPAVLDALRVLDRDGFGVFQDPRVQLTTNDARNTLLTEDRRYDVIVSQPSHPWLAGAANVFTADFWWIARSRLNEGGVFGQWVNLFHMDAMTLRSIFKAFYSVFPHGLSFANLDTGDLLLVGSGCPVAFDYSRIEAVLGSQRLKAVLDGQGIHTVNDLLWYFALSRDEMLAAAGDAPANTDRNIISEVRLSRLVSQPQGDQDPYAFLRRSFGLDLIPYLGEQAADRLESLARYYFVWEDDVLAEKAGRQLLKLDPVRGRGIEYERLWRRLEYDKAFALFGQHKVWQDRIFALQALAQADLGNMDKAFETTAHIQDSGERRVAQAQLWYKLGDWDRITAQEALSDAERRWQLIVASDAELRRTGRELEALVPEDSIEIPSLRALLRYHVLAGDTASVDRLAKRLAASIDSRVAELTALAEQALGARDLDRTRLLVERIEALDLRAGGLAKLRAGLEER